MIFVGLLVGIYSYVLFFLGILGLLSSDIVRVITFVFLLISIVGFAPSFLRDMRGFTSERRKIYTLDHGLILLLALMFVVNFIGAIGPELAFDSLWYHLTLSKLYLLKETVVFVPGGLLYYSAMPKLVEMLYSGGFALGGEVYPKITQFLFGLFTLVFIYKTSRLFVAKTIALLACVVFYANLVVAWESITAYVDLAWTFFSFGSVYLFLRYSFERKKTLLYLSGVFVGIAISIKIVAIGSLILLFLAMLFLKFQMARAYRLSVIDFLIVFLSSLVIPIPWLLFSLIHTGNLLYPFFTPLYQSSFPLFTAGNVFQTLAVFFVSPDPISPVYALFLPLVFFYRKHFSQKESIVLALAGGALAIWFVTPKSGGGRFLLSFLPILSVVIAILIEKIQKNRLLYRFVVCIVIIVMIVSIGYRGVANSKYLPVISGEQSEGQFLKGNLNYSYGDFYDVDGFFADKFQEDDVVLLIGFHNIFYVNFGFIDQSWVRKGDTFHYIAVQNSVLPQRFSSLKKIYENKLTGVSVYGEDGKIWTY